MSASPFSLIVVLSLLASFQAFAVRPIRYVNGNALFSGNGQSWEKAFINLQDALAAAQPGDDIWVAQGTYFPDTGSTATNNDRHSTFAMKTDVAIYGGFVVNNNLFSSRDPVANVTILSGDLTNSPATKTDNAYHIVTATSVAATAILDGFTITDGNADSTVFPDSGGSGMISFNGSSQIVNCIFAANTSLRLGGAIYLQGTSTPSFTGCTFTGNSNTQQFGGGCVFVVEATAAFLNCTFSTNTSAGDGAGLYLKDCTSTLTNCIFTGNNSARQGGGILIESSTPTLTGCSFTGNTATSNGGAIFATRSLYTLATCSFSQNSSGKGGAVFNQGSSPTATNCTFTQNTATQDGGAMIGTTTFDPEAKSNPNLSGCTFTGNSANNGGALFCDASETSASTPVITNCTFTSNTATSTGGAIGFSQCSPQLTGSSFTTNSATNSSAGAVSFFHVVAAAVSGSTFNGNHAPNGGALNLNQGGLSVTGCSFTANTSTNSGGAMTLGTAAADPAASFTTCSYSGNTSGFGGAVNINGSSTDTPTWTNCSFIGNSGTSRSGAIDSSSSSPIFRSCAFSGNSSGSRGAAGYFGTVGSPAFTNCTVSGNSAVLGGALSFNNNFPAFANCIVFNNQGNSGSTTSQNDSLQLDNGATSTFTHSLIANFTKANLDAGASPDTNFEPLDPKFVTPPNPASAPTTTGNLALKPGSPAIDVGSNAALSLALDLAGKPRVFNTIIDLGAFENQGADPFFGDLDGDGNSGGIELALGTNPAVSDAGNPRNLRMLPGSITFGYDSATAATIALELRRSTDLVNFNVVIASSIAGFPAAGPGGIITVTDPSPPAGKAFYRLQATPR